MGQPVGQSRQLAGTLPVDRPGNLGADRRQGRRLYLCGRHRRHDGAALYSYFKTGELKSEGSSITEGIGQGRITGNVAQAKVDLPFRIPDAEALPIVFDLLKHEGLCVGSSSGVNVAGAIRLARELGPGHTIVTILCDGGQRYQSKLFNPEFLREKNLPVPDWL